MMYESVMSYTDFFNYSFGAKMDLTTFNQLSLLYKNMVNV